MRTRRRRPLSILVAAMVAALGVSAAGAAEASAVTCDTRTVPVNVAVLQLSVSGTYCRPDSGTPDSAWVLVPGATYDREYWDFRYQPGTYSFARALARRGYAAYAIDRLGSGESSKPLSATITSLAQASAIHQVISRLRSTGLDGNAVARVFIAGHSIGTGSALIEAATYRDVDGAVLTGLGHRLNLPGFTQLFTTQLHLAILDPAFAGTTLDPGYMTTVPGTRKAAFHDPGQVDPGVIAHDEATKDIFSLTEAPDTVALGAVLGYSNQITAPVLLALGGVDSLNCQNASDCSSSAAFRAQEQPYYVNAQCLQAVVLPGVGHDINLHPSAPGFQTQVADWADAVGAGDCPS